MTTILQRTRRKENTLLTLSEPKNLEIKYYLTSNGLVIPASGRWEAWCKVTKTFPNKKIIIQRRIIL
ncbi:MAG: hypothetical protein QQN43_07385 [Nitrosopumilus sp.]